MNPAFLDNMSWEMAEVYGAVSDRILINLAKYFKYYKPGEPVPRSTFEYQARMLAQMGQVSKETMQIIRNGIDGADEALKNTLEQAVIDAVSKAEPELLDAVKKGVLSPAGMPIVAPNQMQAFQRYYQQAADKLNLVNTVMLESTKSAYQQAVSGVIADIELAERVGATQFALDAATGEVVTGVSSWNQALKNATEHMANRGITGFVDHAGHQWSAEAYAAMDIRTTVANTARAAVWETNQNFGNDLYSVSYHNGARPLCYPWQNKVISSTDNARTVTDLDGNEIVVIAQSATSYGQPAGLFGINCKHYPTPFIPGVSLIRGEPQSPEANAKAYEESQHQRALERKIREQKRDLDMMKAQGASPEAIKAQRAKIRETDDEIDAFCEQTGRTRRQNREAVYTKREFPDKEKYDVAAFEHEQQDRIREYYEKGGAQQGYTFGQMTPNEKNETSVYNRVDELKADISKTDDAIKKSESEYQELFSKSLLSYGTEESVELERALNEAQERTQSLYAKLDADRKKLNDYLSTSGEIEAREIFGEIKGSHSMRTDAIATNKITEDLRSQNNCGYCSLAYDARRRGLDCHAPLIYGSNDMALPNCWEGARMQSATMYNPQDAKREIQQIAKDWGVGARGIVEIDHDSVRGHYFMFEVGNNGECVFVDAQTGVVGKSAELSFDSAVPGSVKYCRTDDKKLTKQAILFLEKGSAQ